MWIVGLILAPQYSPILLPVTILSSLLHPHHSHSLLFWWNIWIPGVSRDLGISCSEDSEIAMGLEQCGFHGECWHRALFSARQKPRCMFSGTTASTCNMWAAPRQQKAEQEERKRSRNVTLLFEPWIQPCLKPNLPLDFSNVSQKISPCV